MFVLRSTYQKQLDKNAELINDRDSLRKKLTLAVNDYKSSVNEDVATSTFSLDFDTMNVFSIERLVGSDSLAHTVVGYFVFNPTEGSKQMSRTVHEWTLRCSHQEHERLAKQFNEWKDERK